MQLLDPILATTAAVFQRTTEELIGRSRKRPIVEARHAAMWVIRQRYPSIPLEVIGAVIGGRHYTTVTHALAIVEKRAARNARYRAQLQHVLAHVAAKNHSVEPSALHHQAA